MLNPELYYSVYLAIVTIYTIIISNKYNNYSDSRLYKREVSSPLSSIILTVIMILFIGLRPRHRVFVDMSNYNTSFEYLRDFNFEFNLDTSNIIFDNIMYYLATNGYDIAIFFFLIAAIYFICIYIFSRELFPKDTLYAMVIYLGAFSTFSYGTNGIKAGAAAVIFLCAIGYYHNKILCTVLLLLSIGFHHSMIMPVLACIVCYYYRKPNSYLIFWGLCFIISALHISYFQNLFGGLADDKGANYLIIEQSSDSQFITGFRLDFIIYSLFPIISGYYAIFKNGYSSKFYNWIYCTYILTNAIWMLCMYASFTNRIAYLSWLMLPIVLIYPFFDRQFTQNQYRKLNMVAWGHLGFTIFMQVIYYGLLKL